MSNKEILNHLPESIMKFNEKGITKALTFSVFEDLPVREVSII